MASAKNQITHRLRTKLSDLIRDNYLDDPDNPTSTVASDGLIAEAATAALGEKITPANVAKVRRDRDLRAPGSAQASASVQMRHVVKYLDMKFPDWREEVEAALA